MLELGGCVVKVDYMEKHYCLFRNTIQQQNISKNNTVCSKHDTAAKLYGKVIPVRPTVEIRYMNDVHDTVGIRSRTQNIQNPIYAASAVYLLSLGQKVAQMASTRECRAQDLGGAGSNPGSCKSSFFSWFNRRSPFRRSARISDLIVSLPPVLWAWDTLELQKTSRSRAKNEHGRGRALQTP